MTNIEVKKTTLNDWNRGQTNSHAKCYYTGVTICWVICWNGKSQFAVSRKRDAFKLKAYMEEINYNGVGDVIMAYMQATKDIDIKEV